MKFPKNKANLFLVERWSAGYRTAIVGGFSEPEDADNFKDACTQEFIDKGFQEELDSGRVGFSVTLTTFYG